MKNILNLSRYQVLSSSETEHDYHIVAETTHPPTICLSCGSENTIGNGRQEILIKDTPMHGKRVGIYVQAHRFRCRDCNKSHTERLPDVVDGQRITSRLYRWIGEQSIKKTFTSISHDVGVSEATVRNIFNDYVTELERTTIFDTPEWMGIDEIKIIGKCRGVITNIGDNTVVNLLKDRDKPLMTNYLMKIKDRHKITRVAIDMWKPYKDAVYACLSNATVVIDKFHVVRMANSCLDTIRKGIREDLTKAQRRGLMHDRFLLLRRAHNLDPFQQLTLETWTKNFPALGEAYQAKEAFFAIYDAKSLADAKSAYLAWKSGLTSGITDAFKPLTTAMGNWETEVLNYFEHPVTNAYTECLNGLTRVIDRSGRGYSFEALRAKILFSAGAHKKVIPKFERQRTKPQPEYAMNRMMLMTGFDQDAPSNTKTRLQEKNLGTDINTLLRLMDEGKI